MYVWTISDIAKMLRRFRAEIGATSIYRDFHSSVVSSGRPYKYRDGKIAVHASQRAAEPADIDFQSLGLKYEMNHPINLALVKHCWAPQPEIAPKLPFHIDRTDIGLSLPVYTDFKGGKTKVITIIRKCKGDINALKEEVEKVVGKEVSLRPGKIVVDGNYHRRLKMWLTGLGF